MSGPGWNRRRTRPPTPAERTELEQHAMIEDAVLTLALPEEPALVLGESDSRRA